MNALEMVRRCGARQIAMRNDYNVPGTILPSEGRDSTEYLRPEEMGAPDARPMTCEDTGEWA